MKQMENEMIVSVPLEVVKASEIEPREVKWLWYPYIPFGKVTLLQGDPGDGKSKLMLSIAALLSKGEPLPFTDEETEPMTIIYQTTETSVYKGYKRDKIEMRGDRAEISDFPLYLNTVAGGLDCRDQTIGGFSFVVKIYAVPVVEIIG